MNPKARPATTEFSMETTANSMVPIWPTKTWVMAPNEYWHIMVKLELVLMENTGARILILLKALLMFEPLRLEYISFRSHLVEFVAADLSFFLYSHIGSIL